MENSTTFFTELSLLEQASLSGGVSETTVSDAEGNIIITGSSGMTVNGKPGETVTNKFSTVVGSDKLSKANDKRIARLLNLVERFDY